MKTEKRLENLLKYFGYQGGTIHQIAKETGCSVQALLYEEPKQTYISSDYSNGYFALNTCSLEFRLKFVKQYQGNLDFWLGVAKSD